MPHAAHGMSDAVMQACIEECQRCATVCAQTLHDCLEKGGKHVAAAHVIALVDCAEICRTSASFLSRGSERHAATCRACAEICRACEASCRSMGDDKMMQECAEACRRCAESCEKMAGKAA